MPTGKSYRSHFLAAEPNLELMRSLFGWVRVNCITKAIAATTQLLILLFVCLSACISNHAFPLAMFIIGMKMLPLIHSFVMLQLMMTESLVMSVLLWLSSMPARPAPRLWSIPCGSNLTCQTLLKTSCASKGAAQNSLCSDYAKVQCGKSVLDFLLLYGIKDLQSEPHHQHPNFAERDIRDTKPLTDVIMDHSGMAACLCLLCLLYVVFLLNHLALDALAGGLPKKIGCWASITKTQGDAASYLFDPHG
jgi:hypothetical protein